LPSTFRSAVKRRAGYGAENQLLPEAVGYGSGRALKILEEYLTTHSREQAFDEILVPALNYAKADLHQNKITEREGPVHL
jgi:hypothetical protein